MPDAHGLRLNISEQDNALDLVRSVAPYFRVSARTAREIIANSQAIVRQWRAIARALRLSVRACDQMADAFREATPPRRPTRS